MIRRSLGWLGPLVLAVLVAGASGCTKRIPVESGQFDATQKVVLSFSNDRSLQGRIASGQKVEYRTGDAIYRARVNRVSPDTIGLTEILLIDRGDYETVSRRLADSRLILSPPDSSVVLLRKELQKVELVRLDASRTARGLGFWSYGGALFLLFLVERS